MDSCFGTFAALFLIIAAASCAPTGHNLHDACEDVKTSSLALNHVARIVSMEAQTISKYTPDIISKVDWINSTDMCDPESLKQESTRCIAKMLKVLTSYRSEVERVSRFEICSVANKVKPELSKMLDDMSRCVKHPKVIINEDTRTVERNEQPLLCRYTLDRLFSFSILTARVFALAAAPPVYQWREGGREAGVLRLARSSSSSSCSSRGTSPNLSEGGVKDRKKNKEFPGELRQHRKMNVGVAHSEVNPNTRVMNSRGIWLTYLLLTVVLHIVLLSIPFFTVPLVWTLTNVIHNLVMYLFLHTVKGTPFETPDQGKARLLTHWEQMDYGVQFTSSRKFLTISPIVLYILASFYTKYDPTHFLINTSSLLSVLLPKLPQFHGVRIFGINKY
ncbi:ORM1-like protein 2 [Larimichthys crocea]|uniref:Uncharacterized protein n=1 Tax=Larimichthys crocea TaxID=215358 RepID=A0ACD3R9D7_LARCR|nr:ORM1-like protein 2 [Larimichthys crocea]